MNNKHILHYESNICYNNNEVFYFFLKLLSANLIIKKLSKEGYIFEKSKCFELFEFLEIEDKIIVLYIEKYKDYYFIKMNDLNFLFYPDFNKTWIINIKEDKWQ